MEIPIVISYGMAIICFIISILMFACTETVTDFIRAVGVLLLCLVLSGGVYKIDTTMKVITEGKPEHMYRIEYVTSDDYLLKEFDCFKRKYYFSKYCTESRKKVIKAEELSKLVE